MIVAYNKLPDTAKVWIYQADRSFSETEEAEIKEQISVFLDRWQVHGKNLIASFIVKYQQFIILLVDDSKEKPSGCSIDAFMNLVQQIEVNYQVNLTNKLNIAFKNKQIIKILSLSDFKKQTSEGKITKDTIVFNNLITTKKDLETNWEVTAANSWHKRFLA